MPAGNTALPGAKRALFEEAARWDAITKRAERFSMSEDPNFQEIYAEGMGFPG